MPRLVRVSEDATIPKRGAADQHDDVDAVLRRRRRVLLLLGGGGAC
ncbi:hypothetical protein ACFFKU_09735 [Kineococcus gynurae]